MTIKQAIEIAIASGMTTFTLRHHTYTGRALEQTINSVYDFIKGYEDCDVMSLHLGNWHSLGGVYTRPTHCNIIYKLSGEKL